MTSKKETKAAEADAENLVSDDLKKAQEMAQGVVDRHAESREYVDGAESTQEEAQEKAEKIVQRQHDAQQTVGPTKDA